MSSISSTKCILFFLSIFLITGCFNNKREEGENIKQQFLNDYQKELDRHSIIDTSSYKYIRLETNKKSSFGDIDKVIIDDDRIIILDRNIAKKVLMFDLDGNFICQIGKAGKGPDEFELIQDVDIDTDKKQVVLFDVSSRKLLFYNYNGDFIKNVQLDSYPGMTLGVISSNKYAFYLHRPVEKGEKQLLFYNSDGNFIDQKFDLKNRKVVFAMPDYFARQGNNLFFIPIFGDKLFRIQKDGKISEVFDFQISELMVTDDDKKDGESSGELLKLKKFFYFHSLAVANNGQFYCEMDYAARPFSIIGDLESDKLKIGGLLLGAGDMPGPILGSYKDYFIGSFHPNQHELKSLFPGATWADNQGILLFKFHNIFKQ